MTTLGVFKIEDHEPVSEHYHSLDDFMQRIEDNDDGDIEWATWDGVPLDLPDSDDGKTYRIDRCYGPELNKPRETLIRGLTLAQAQEHCSRDDTHGDGWFDAYYEET